MHATGKIYVIGGFDLQMLLPRRPRTWGYDPVANTSAPEYHPAEHSSGDRLFRVRALSVSLSTCGARDVGRRGGIDPCTHRYDIYGQHVVMRFMTAVPQAMYAPATGAIGSQIFTVMGGEQVRPARERRRNLAHRHENRFQRAGRLVQHHLHLTSPATAGRQARTQTWRIVSPRERRLAAYRQ